MSKLNVGPSAAEVLGLLARYVEMGNQFEVEDEVRQHRWELERLKDYRATTEAVEQLDPTHLRTLSLTLPEPEQADKAALWDALMGSARLRILGYAGPHDTGYAHFGLEAWTMYPGHDFSENNASARQIITDYCRAALTLVTDATEGEP